MKALVEGGHGHLRLAGLAARAGAGGAGEGLAAGKVHQAVARVASNGRQATNGRRGGRVGRKGGKKET